jgi:hypothetical protein
VPLLLSFIIADKRQCPLQNLPPSNRQTLTPVIGHGIVGKDIPIMARLAEARRWSKR